MFFSPTQVFCSLVDLDLICIVVDQSVKVCHLFHNIHCCHADWNDPSYVAIRDSSNQVLFKSQLTEAVLSPDQNHTDVVPPYNAYSAPGNIQVPYFKLLLFNFLLTHSVLIGCCQAFRVSDW